MIPPMEATLSNDPKPTYEKPAIINSESLETRAVLCNKSSTACATINN
jgi:hypothetical protein